jgi:hypothetical protein
MLSAAFHERNACMGAAYHTATCENKDNTNYQITWNSNFLHSLGEVGVRDSHAMNDWRSGIKHPSAHRFQLILKRSC